MITNKKSLIFVIFLLKDCPHQNKQQTNKNPPLTVAASKL